MICRACKFEHPPLVRCEVAARLREVTKTVAKNPDILRVQKWREKNRERYNEKQRLLMRKNYIPKLPKPCVVCGQPARTANAKFCENCFVGSRPSSIEYAVARAVRQGLLKPIRECICVDCGKPAQHYDHRDYNKPLEVEPVCVACNHARGHAIRYGLTAEGKPRPDGDK